MTSKLFKDDLNKFIITLAKMRELVEYFPDGFDFGIDLHDPVVYDIIEISANSETFRDVVDSEPFMSALFRGMKRHITLEIRNVLIELLESIQPHVKSKHLNLVKHAHRTIEDASVDPAIIGVVWQLYVQNIFDKAFSRPKKNKPYSAKLKEQFAQLLEQPDAPIAEEIFASGEEAVRYIEGELDETLIIDIAPNVLDKLIEVLAHIPGHYPARVLGELYLLNDGLAKKVLKACKGIAQLHFLKIYFLNKLERSDTDFPERWACHKFLVTVNDPHALQFMREELLHWEFWADHPQRKSKRTGLMFYSQLFQWMISLKDRRAIPVFIKLLFEGEKMGYHPEVLAIAEDLLAGTPWLAEVKQGVYYLKEGETVFVEKDVDANAQIGENLEKYASMVRRLNGKPPKKSDIRKKVKYSTRRWNGAYHEDLDGLRPIDLPEPEIKYELLESMMMEFERKVRRRKTPRKKAMRLLPKFQGKWMTRPQAVLGGKIPIALIMQEAEALATTRAQKEHFKRYKQDTINRLYLEAASHYDASQHRDAARKVNTVLALDPSYPFAKRLKRKLLHSAF